MSAFVPFAPDSHRDLLLFTLALRTALALNAPMPRRSKPTPADFPPPGTVLAFSLDDGRFGAGRILRVDSPDRSNTTCALVILTEFIGAQPPRLDDPALRRALLLNHHLWSNQPELFWAFEPPPFASFHSIGVIAVTAEETTTESWTYAGWESLPLQRLLQWRWEHDRAALLVEEEAEKAAEKKKRAEAAERRARILAQTTLPMIQQRPTLFPRWKEHLPAATIRAIEEPIRTLVDAVAALAKPTRRDITRELRICVKALNTYDTKNQHSIETIERDDLFELFEEILTVAKQPDLIEKLDQWRDW